MKELAIDIANTNRELEKSMEEMVNLEEALGMTMEELESSVNGNITTDFVTIYKAVSDGVNIGLDIGKMLLEGEDSLKSVPHMHLEINKIMKRFSTLGEKLDNV